MRAAAIAGAVFAAFIGVMYLRFASDGVPPSEPATSPRTTGITVRQPDVRGPCVVAQRADARHPAPSPAGGRAPCATLLPFDPSAGVDLTLTTPPPQPQVPEMLSGMTIIPLELGPPTDLPQDLAIVIETGCTQCDGGPTGLVRVYVRPDGSVSNEPLLDTARLGLPVRQYTSPDGTVHEYPPSITGYAIMPDASRIVAGICLRGTCAPEGLTTWSADSQTALFGSLDGGISWTEIGRLDVGASVLGLLPTEEIILATYDTRESTAIRLYPSLDELQVPPASQYGGFDVLPDGELVWRDEHGIFVRSDGRSLISFPLGVGPRPVDEILVEPAQMDGLALLSGYETAPPYTHYLVPFDSAGEIGRGGFGPEGGRVGYSTDAPIRLGAVLADGRVLGNAWVPTDEIAPNGQPLISIPAPVLVDLVGGMINPLRPFTNTGSFRSRNTVAFQQGPFARVVNTDNTCLNIRAEPGAGQVLDCAAEAVLLRDLLQVVDIDGVVWLRVRTPAGTEGWASTQYLER